MQGGISNILEELVVQPLLVSVSALALATETVRSILKIDDVVRYFSSMCMFYFKCDGTMKKPYSLYNGLT